MRASLRGGVGLAMLLAVVLAGAGCGRVDPPGPTGDTRGGEGGGDDVDDTAEPCGDCTLYDCEDDDAPDVTTESECEDAASDLGCASWEWDAC